MKKSKAYDHALGMAAQETVKKKLRSYKLSVEDYSNYLPFDLLVDKRYKVEVKYSSMRQYSKNCFGWAINGLRPVYYDVLAVVLQVPLGQKILFAKVNEKNKELFTKESLLLNEKKIKDFGFQETIEGLFEGREKPLKLFDDEGTRRPLLQHWNWYSMQEVALIMDKSAYHVRNLLDTNQIKNTKSGKGEGRRYRVMGKNLIEYLANLDCNRELDKKSKTC